MFTIESSNSPVGPLHASTMEEAERLIHETDWKFDWSRAGKVRGMPGVTIFDAKGARMASYTPESGMMCRDFVDLRY